MSLFFSASDKELLEARNNVFLTYGAPTLFKSDFIKAPFLSSWYGRNNLKDFTYEFCRLTPTSQLEQIVVHISRGDSWIKVYLNIFQLEPYIQSIDELNGFDCLQFHLPPNSITQMRLKCDDFRGAPLLNFDYMFRNHKVGFYYSKTSLARKLTQLGKRIEGDLININSSIYKWHEMHQVQITSWEGKPM